MRIELFYFEGYDDDQALYCNGELELHRDKDIISAIDLAFYIRGQTIKSFEVIRVNEEWWLDGIYQQWPQYSSDIPERARVAE